METPQASCALEFELDLVLVCINMERSSDFMVSRGGSWRGKEACGGGNDEVDPSPGGEDSGKPRIGGEGLQEMVSTLLAAASRARLRASRQDRERVIRDAGFDPALSSKWVVITEGGQLVSSADSGHSHSLVRQCLRRGVWSWVLGLERESSGDETTCVGVAVNPVANSCYEDSHQVRVGVGMHRAGRMSVLGSHRRGFVCRRHVLARGLECVVSLPPPAHLHKDVDGSPHPSTAQ